MPHLKYVQVAAVGLLGWAGGVYFERFKLLKKIEVEAAQILPAGNVEPVPMEIDLSTSRTAQIMKFGFPGLETIRTRNDFVLSYDRRNRVANWVFEHLTKDGIKYNETVDRSKSSFFEDDSIHHYFRSQNRDYYGSGFDRGHLAAAGNHRSSQPLIDETFVLSNITPQVGKGFNRDAWNRLEKYVRHLVKKKYQNVYVCTGPLYLPREETDGKRYVKYQVLGANNVAVPTHFFKVIVGETENHEFDLEAYVMQNTPIEDSVPLNAFMVPKESIERAAGFLLFDKINSSRFRSINGVRKGK